MSLYHNAKLKLRNIGRTLNVLLDSEFPLSAGERALKKLQSVFAELDGRLDRANRLSNLESLRNAVDNINVKVYQTLPILGLILRSTNVRNAFEFLDPLQDLADKVLQGNPQLVLSSEWDFVPFAWPQSLEDLRSFVLIGMPASEAASALLLPLAAHELGHAVWRNRGLDGSVPTTLQLRCEQQYTTNIAEFRTKFPEYDPNDILKNDVLPEAIAHSVEYAVYQAEELFADMFAYSVFGLSYVHAFAYILSPGSGRAPSAKYPLNRTRLEVLARLAAAENVSLPTSAELGFIQEQSRGDSRHQFILRMAEESTASLVDTLWTNNLAILAEKKVHRPTAASAQAHLKEFRLGIPATQPKCLGDIATAGWEYYAGLQKAGHSLDKMDEMTAHLNELLLKTVEVLEFHRRTR